MIGQVNVWIAQFQNNRTEWDTLIGHGNDWLAQFQDNVTEWDTLIIWGMAKTGLLSIRIMWLSRVH